MNMESREKNLSQNQDQKIKVLVSDTAPLYPPQWGGPKRIWNLFSNFPQDIFEFTYIGVTFEGSPESKCRHKSIRNNFEEILTVFPPHYRLWHFMEKIFLRDSHLDLFPYLAMNTDWRFKRLLNCRKADIIICSHPWSSPSIRKKRNQFFIYDAHNCEYLLMARILERRLFTSLILSQVKRIEGAACRRSDLILVCSAKEKEDLVSLYKVNPQKIVVIPNGSQVKAATSPQEKESSRRQLHLDNDQKVVVFVGMYYKPNIDAARFIIEKIAPQLPDFKFLLIGALSEAFVSVKLPANVKFLGRISDEQLETALRAADLAINPMFDGAGMNIKMLDYMSYGLPIVSTECGLRGIENCQDDLMIRSSAANFAEDIKMLSHDHQLSQRLSVSGRNLVAEHYDWKTISRKLQGTILERLRYQ